LFHYSIPAGGFQHFLLFGNCCIKLPVFGHTSHMKNKFILCGLMGWCLEIFWTGLKSFQRRQMKLEGHSSIWMFPIYGMAAFIGPASRFLRRRSLWLRGSIYTCCIFLTEFVTGSFLKKHNMCPWDYSKARFNIRGIIRLDYAPVWFLTGLLYERILRIEDGRAGS